MTFIVNQERLPDFSRIADFYVGEQLYTGAYIQRAVGFTGDLLQEMAEISSWVAYWGAVSADAKQLHDAKESAYRTARDRYITSRSAAGVKDKIAKTAAEAEWRTRPEYADWERQKGETERAWNIASFVYESLLRKANMLQSMTKLYIDDRGAARAAQPPRGP